MRFSRRQDEPDAGPAIPAVGAYPAAVGLDQFPGDRQAETGPPGIATAGTVGTEEVLEDEGQVIAGDFRAAVAEQDLQPIALASAGDGDLTADRLKTLLRYSVSCLWKQRSRQ